MPNKLKIKGWVQMDAKPVRAKTFAADLTSAPTPKPQSKLAADAVKPLARPAKSKLRAVFVRPAHGSDAQAKLVIVDEDDKPKFAQG